MAISRVDFGGQTLIDLTNDSVTPETLMAGETAHDAAGRPIVGTAVASQGVTVHDLINNETNTLNTITISDDDLEEGKDALAPGQIYIHVDNKSSKPTPLLTNTPSTTADNYCEILQINTENSIKLICTMAHYENKLEPIINDIFANNVIKYASYGILTFRKWYTSTPNLYFADITIVPTRMKIMLLKQFNSVGNFYTTDSYLTGTYLFTKPSADSTEVTYTSYASSQGAPGSSLYVNGTIEFFI